jgi:ligand-binding sensor domain-containing protein/signal transduction histidine kinase
MSSPRAFLASFTALLLGFLGVCPSAHAVSNLLHAGYLVRNWQTEDGLPQNTVTALAQTTEGYLWVGTLAGLARFDGVRFTTFDSSSSPRLSDTRISALFADAHGALWIGHESGVVTKYEQGRFNNMGSPASRSAKVVSIFADDKGAVWVLRENGELSSGENKLVLPAPVAPDHNLNLRFAHDPRGRNLFSADSHLLELRDGQFEPLKIGTAHESEYIRSIGAGTEDDWWIVWDNRVRRWTRNGWQEERGGWNSGEINALTQLRDGSLALATMESGLELLQPDGTTTRFNFETARIPNWVRVLFEDREGVLWLGVGTGGLIALRPTDVAVHDAPDSWQGHAVLSVMSSRDGSLWVGTEGGGIYRHVDGAWEHFGAAEGLVNQYIWSLAEDSAGQIWAGTWTGEIYHRVDSRFVRVPELENVSAPVFALHFDASRETTWAGTGNGLLRVERNYVSWLLHDLPGGNVSVSDIARDRSGALWLALGENGVARIAANKLTRFSSDDGLTGNGAQCLLPDGNTLWIGTREAGLNRFREGKFVALSLDQGLPSKVICHIIDDGAGYLWLSTHHGIVRVKKDELNRCADGLAPTVSAQIYDRTDGLPTLEFSGGLQAAGARSGDGRLWFPSGKGLVSIDPSRLKTNSQPPPVQIESLLVDGHPVEFPASRQGELRLEPQHERLEFQFTALSLVSAGKNRFKYRLVGLDKEWIDAGTRRVAFYSHLPPGDYRFHVIGCNNDGVWNTTGASLPFQVLPFFWQTWWFASLVALLVLSAVAWIARAATRRRMQQRVAELEYERSLDRERARIAQDIHDDIGSSLTRITMLSQPARPHGNAGNSTEVAQAAETGSVSTDGSTALPGGGAATAVVPARLAAGPTGTAAPALARIHETALQITDTLDEIVWALNPRHDTLSSLACYLARFAQERLDEAGVSCRLDLPLNLPLWPVKTQARHHLLLAFKEALNNALKHSGADEIRIALELGRNDFRIIVQDNGRGFTAPEAGAASPNLVNQRHGLSNLQARLAAVGGTCEIKSAPGQGTHIIFALTLAPEKTAGSRRSANEEG